MQLSLDLQSKVPIYIQIVEQVKGLIVSGVLHPGEQLPTVREMAANLRINFNTVARAYRLLHEEGVISTQQGRGTYVLGQASVDRPPGNRRKILTAIVESWLAEAHRLGYSPEEVDEAWSEARNKGR
ncbi:MAG: GntR family transcriptional regulator [Anaerolineae bacterium]